VNAIAVVDKNWGIGADGKLLAHLPGDLRYFKEKTLGNTIIIGRTTFESMSGKILPGRETVILSKNADFKADCPVFRSLEETLSYCRGKADEELFVAGGEAIYRLFFPFCDRFYITKLHETFEADRHFPNLDEEPERFDVRELSGILGERGVRYQFFEYTRVK